MKRYSLISGLMLSLLATGATADSSTPQIYLNQNLGFNVEGYKYEQAQYPCNIDAVLVESLLNQSRSSGIRMEAVSTIDKIRNGVIPVLAIDIEQLVLGENFQFGAKSHSNLPRVQVTAALIRDQDNFVTAKHNCAIATLNEFTPSSNILDMGTAATVCSATRKCLRDLSKDIVQWVAPQIK